MTRRYTLERTDFIGCRTCRRDRAVSVLRQQAGDYLSLRAGNYLVCRGRTHALLFIGNLQMPRVYR